MSILVREVLLPLAGLALAFAIGYAPVLWVAWKERRHV